MNTRPRVTPGEVARALAAWPVVAAVRLALWRAPSVIPAPPASRETAHAPGDADAATRARALRTAHAVRRAARLVPGATCLTQAVAARRLLARQGIVAELRFGVARGEHEPIVAHAWLELGDEVILGDSPTRYAVIDVPRSQPSPRG